MTGDDARREDLDLLVRCMDLTSLEGSDTTERIRALCARAARPDPDDPSVPPVAAVCVYPRHVPTCVEALADSGVAVASVAGGFPSGLTPLEARLAEVRWVVAAGADEVDVVLNRSLVLEGRDGEALEELRATREAAGDRVLKVILETGELVDAARIRAASTLAIAAGADFVKTSTGKIARGATLPDARAIMEAVAAHHAATGRRVGVKVAGGVRTAADGLAYLDLLGEVLGEAWRGPTGFRVGASSLLDDVLATRRG